MVDHPKDKNAAGRFASWGWRMVSSVIAQRRWRDTDDAQLRSLDLTEGKRLSDAELYALGERIFSLPASLFRSWSSSQLDGLSRKQIVLLTPQQLQALVTNPDLAQRHTQAIIQALAKASQYHKLGEILHALPLSSHPEQAWSWALEAMGELAEPHCLAFLRVAAMQASDSQFNQLLEEIPLSKIKDYFLADRLSPNDPKYLRLKEQVEERDHAYNVNLQKIEQSLARLHRWWQASSIPVALSLSGELAARGGDAQPSLQNVASSLDSLFQILLETAPLPDKWRKQVEHLVEQREGLDPQKVLEGCCHLVSELRRWFACEHDRYVDRLRTVPQFVQHWRDEYLPDSYGEHTCDLGNRRLEALLSQADGDFAFLHEAWPEFQERVQLDGRCGDFSVQFLTRLIAQKLEEPAELFLDTEGIEELLLLPGMLEVLELIELQHQVEMIITRLEEYQVKNSRRGEHGVA